ncbi:RHS repeat-associated core domain-containing protein [Pseudomonas sp. MLB6B]
MITLSDSRIFYNGESVSVVENSGYGRYVLHVKNIPLAQGQAADKATSSLHATLLATEQNGSVLSQVEPGTRAAHTYSVYGYDNPPAEENALLGFTGQLRLLRSIYSLGKGYRIYNTGIRRFCSPDSYSPFGRGGLNAYAYCENDPINQVDPTGHSRRSMAGRMSLNDFKKISPAERLTLRQGQLEKNMTERGEITKSINALPRPRTANSGLTSTERSSNAETRIKRSELLAKREQLDTQISTNKQLIDLHQSSSRPVLENSITSPQASSFERLSKMMNDPENKGWDDFIRANPTATLSAYEISKYNGNIRES